MLWERKTQGQQGPQDTQATPARNEERQGADPTGHQKTDATNHVNLPQPVHHPRLLGDLPRLLTLQDMRSRDVYHCQPSTLGSSPYRTCEAETWNLANQVQPAQSPSVLDQSPSTPDPTGREKPKDDTVRTFPNATVRTFPNPSTTSFPHYTCFNFFKSNTNFSNPNFSGEKLVWEQNRKKKKTKKNM